MISSRTLLRAAGVFGVTMTAVAWTLFVAFDGLPALTVDRAMGLAGLSGLGAVAYGVILWLARHNFRSDARLGGRRDAIAALLATALLFLASTLTQGAPAFVVFTLCLAAGAAGALGAHFPWLQRRAARAESVSARMPDEEL